MSTLWRAAPASVVLAMAGSAVCHAADAPRDEPRFAGDGGYSVQIDNDLFSGAHRDQDYSWGVSVNQATPHPGTFTRPLHAIRDTLDGWLAPDGPAWVPEQQALQLGILAMTPNGLHSPEPVPGERPFANLIFATSSDIRVLEGGERARFSSFTFGLLGLHAAETIHRTAHRWIGNMIPQGWEHQISAGGEPTARYVEAQQWLLSDGDPRNTDLPEVKLTVAGSAGFITEASVGLSARWGRIQSPWWGFDPELADYTGAPVAPVVHYGSSNPAEMFFFAGFRLKARAYNALLQGQLRHSDVRVQGDDLAHMLAEAWIGLASTWDDRRITYAVHFETTETTVQPGRRSLVWAGIDFERSL